jgi:hypothetical protein
MPAEPVETVPIEPRECEQCHCTFTPKKRWKRPPRFHNNRCRTGWHNARKTALLAEARASLKRVGEILEALAGEG